MRRTIVSLALAMALSAAAQAGYQVVRLGDVLALAREGVSSRTIISFLETRPLGFAVGTEEILRLRDAGAGEDVIRYLIERTAPRDSQGPESYGAGAYASPPDPYSGDAPYEDTGYAPAYVDYGPSYSIDASIVPYYVGGYYGGGYYGDGGYYGGRYDRGGFGHWLARQFGFGRRGGYYVSDGRGWRHQYDHGRRYDYGRRYDHGYGRDLGYGRDYRYSRPSRGYRAAYATISRGYSVPQGRAGGRFTRSGGDHAVPRGASRGCGRSGGGRGHASGGHASGGHGSGRGRR